MMQLLKKLFGTKSTGTSQRDVKEAARQAVEDNEDVLRDLEAYDKGERQFDPSHLGELGKYTS